MIIRVGNRELGTGKPCFMVAEIGINHNGSMELAREMIDAAAASGADAVKFQNYRTEDFILDSTLTYSYESQGKKVTESQFDMFKRCELTVDQLVMLSEHCAKRNVVFFSTPTSKQGIDDLLRAKSPIIKNGSDYLVNIPLIEDMASTGLPVVISTGMATLGEIDDAVRAFEGAGGRQLIILHCTSSYPTPDADINLRKIKALQEAFSYPVGFSDHTWGVEAGIAAVVLGACLIEKHFTIDRNLPGPDHRFSSDPLEFAQLVRSVRKIEKALGASKVGPTPSEENGRKDFRLSCGVARSIKQGHQLTIADIAFIRPGTGVPPKWVHALLGKSLRRDMEKGELLNFSDLDAQ